MSPRATRRLSILGMWIALLACLLVGALPVTTLIDRRAVPVDAAVEHVEAIASGPHPMGSVAIATVRDRLIAGLREVGLEPITQSAEAPDYFGAPGATVEIVNVMARIEGTGGGDEAIVLVAHYDTVPSTPGANDNSAAVAAMIEAGRDLMADPPETDVILLLTDGEEPTPRFGATAFTQHPWFDDVVLAANFEGIGAAGPAVLVEMNGPPREMIRSLAIATSDAPAFSVMTRTAELIGGAASDFDVFSDHDIPGYNFAYLRGPSIYHTDRDAIDALNVEGMAHQATLMVEIARGLGDADLAAPDHGAVFFTLAGGPIARYGQRLTVTTVIAAVAVAVWGLVARKRYVRGTPRRVMKGAAASGIGGLIAVVVATLLWMGVSAWRADMGVGEGYLWLATLVVIVVGAWMVIPRLGTRIGADTVGGSLVIWTLLAVVTGLLLPEWSYLFTWPTIAAGLVMTIGSIQRPGARVTLLVMVAFPASIVLVPVIDTFFQLASPRPGNPDSNLAPMIAIPLFLVFLAVALIGPLMRRRLGAHGG